MVSDTGGPTESTLVSRLRRTVRMMTAIHQMMVRERDPQRILEESCRIATSTGGLPLAWIGEVSEPGGGIRILAQAGASPDTLAILESFCTHPERICAFTLEALATGSPSACHDVARDPKAEPWRAAALDRGYRSLISLPILRPRAPAAVFNLYAGDIGFFDQDEREMLSELSQSVAYAWHACRIERDRSEADQRLRVSEARYRGLVEESSDIVMRFNREGLVTFVNPAVRALLGYEPEEYLGKPLDMVLTDESARLATDSLRRRLSGDFGTETVVQEYTLRKRTGEEVVFEIKSGPLVQVDHCMTEFQLTAREITERKRAESALRQRAAVLSAVRLAADRFLRASSIEVVLPEVLASAGKAAEVSRAYVFRNRSLPDGRKRCDQIFEWVADGVDPQLDNTELQSIDFAALGCPRWPETMERGEAIHGPLRDFPPNEIALLESQNIRALAAFPIRADGAWWGFIGFDECRRDREWHETELDALRMLAGILGAAIERTRAEECLRQSEARLREAQELAHLGHWEQEHAAGLLRWSPEVFRIFECPPSTAPFPVAAFFDVVHPEDRERVATTFAESLRHGNSAGEVEHRLLLPDGQIKHVYERWRTTFAPDGSPVRTHGTVLDLTDQRRLEEQFRHAQKLEAVGQLAGGVAHDFNNILTALFMHLESLLDHPAVEGDARESLREIEKGAHRAAELTRQLLLFGRRTVAQWKVLDLGEVMLDLKKMLRRLIGETVFLDMSAESFLPPIRADRGMIEQVIVNLCVNARDAMPRGGNIRVRAIRTEWDQSATVHGLGRRPGSFACLSVSDTGCGMDPTTRQRIFEPFFTTKEVGKGTGLGLATVHGIVQQHQGWIEVESTPGQGTIFRVYLPALPASAEASQPDELKPQESTPLGSGTILLVEDEPSVRRALELQLKRWGYRVHVASHGPEALLIWERHGASIDLLFTDAVMPGGLTGLQLAAQLRELRPDLRVILSSGYSAEIVRSDPSDLSEIIFVPKPCPPRTLATTIHDCLRAASTAPSRPT